MRLRTDWPALSIVLALSVWLASPALAQIGDVMAHDAAGAETGSDEPGAGRLSPSDRGEDTNVDDDEEEERDDEVAGSEGDEEYEPMEYRVGSTLPIEVGGHLLASFFTIPSNLRPGFGLQGRIATALAGKLIGEGNVGIMFNPDRADSATYKTAFLRAGVRYPVDLGAKPVLFFVGGGAALNVFWVNGVGGSPGVELSRSALSPSFDLQLGALYELGERLAIEVLAQGAYAFPSAVFAEDPASWISLLAGVSYDL